eukprot:366477-Chlamydomonas_euryale.AAC.3
MHHNTSSESHASSMPPWHACGAAWHMAARTCKRHPLPVGGARSRREQWLLKVTPVIAVATSAYVTLHTGRRGKVRMRRLRARAALRPHHQHRCSRLRQHRSSDFLLREAACRRGRRRVGSRSRDDTAPMRCWRAWFGHSDCRAVALTARACRPRTDAAGCNGSASTGAGVSSRAAAWRRRSGGNRQQVRTLVHARRECGGVVQHSPIQTVQLLLPGTHPITSAFTVARSMQACSHGC